MKVDFELLTLPDDMSGYNATPDFSIMYPCRGCCAALVHQSRNLNPESSFTASGSFCWSSLSRYIWTL